MTLYFYVSFEKRDLFINSHFKNSCRSNSQSWDLAKLLKVIHPASNKQDGFYLVRTSNELLCQDSREEMKRIS